MEDIDGCYAKSFANVIAKNFEPIKQSFILMSKQHGFSFDEDLFMDAFIKCEASLKNKTLSDQEYIKYFWTAYKNHIISAFKPSSSEVDERVLPHLFHTYDISIDYKYEHVTATLGKKFDTYYIQAFMLHYADNKSYKELIELGYSFKHNNIFKRMMKYLKTTMKSTE